MYLAGTPSKGNLYYRVFESTYVDGREKKRVLLYLGRLDGLSDSRVAEHWQAVRALGNERVLQEFSKTIAGFGYDVQTLPLAERVLHHGDVAAMWHIVEELGLIEIIDDEVTKGGGPAAGTVAAIAATIQSLHPSSKNRMGDWYVDTTLSVLAGLPPQSVHAGTFYACMRALSEDTIRAIERRAIRRIVELYDIRLDFLVYDITSTYFYGRGCDLAEFGYNRDKVVGRQQVNIGMTVTQDHGFYVRSDMFTGDTSDITTLVTTGQALHDDHGSHEVTLVFDRGMVSADNFEEIEKQTHFGIVCGLKKSENEPFAILEACPPVARWSRLEDVPTIPPTALVGIEGIDPIDPEDPGQGEEKQSSSDADELEEVIHYHQVFVDLYGKKRNVIVLHREGLASNQRANRRRRIERAQAKLEELSKTWSTSLPSHRRAIEGSHDAVRGVKRFFHRMFEVVPARPVFTVTKRFVNGDVDGRRIRHAERRIWELDEELKKSWEVQPDDVDSPRGMDAATVRIRLREILQNVRDLYSYRVQMKKGGCRFQWSVDEATVTEAERWDGYYLLMASNLDLLASKVYTLYHARDDVERGFHVIKSDVRIRPVFHRRGPMVRAHVFLCMLAYQIRTTLRYRLKKADIDMSVHQALLELGRMRAQVVDGSKIALLALPSMKQVELAKLFCVEGVY